MHSNRKNDPPTSLQFKVFVGLMKIYLFPVKENWDGGLAVNLRELKFSFVNFASNE